MNKAMVPALLLVAGCASTTGVIPTGSDNYMIAREDNTPAASLGNIKAQAFKEAATFCAGKGRSLKTISESDTPRSLGQFPQTTLHFTCVG
jgi:hypothetical protein